MLRLNPFFVSYSYATLFFRRRSVDFASLYFRLIVTEAVKKGPRRILKIFNSTFLSFPSTVGTKSLFIVMKTL